MSLKELTMQQHRNAERQKFAGVLMSGEIPEKFYLIYLMNQYSCYQALENHPLFVLPHPNLNRSEKIQDDINELNDRVKIGINNVLTNSTLDYVNHTKNIKSQEDFNAHVYVRYLGDLRGGQMIAKKTPGKGRYYDFNKPNELATSIYEILNDDMAEEAKKVFTFATRLFVEMHDLMISDLN
jgi:heme oxygenase